ncbi:MAG TPA: UDP-glucose/GDP-mannose dehydrogenase family protein [Acidimicrobiia bacterium]|nr:UDP-glucose/GDP-mannose dehydrogenase family protein [Acidimicrobiia bacterium]
MRSVAVIGNGVVGSVVAGCFALLGRHVVGVETDQRRLAVLQAGRAPVREDGLDALLTSGIASGRLRFTDDLGEALACSSAVFLCTGGSVETAREVLGACREDHIVVVKSTLPIGTTGSVVPGPVVCNPEFLRQGSAIADFLHPDRVVLGADDHDAMDVVVELYRPILEQTVPGREPSRRPVLVRTSIAAAEMVKHASNAFLALKVSFANELGNICAAAGVDVGEVTEAVGLDGRIGLAHLAAGLGWGGSCLGKDLTALIEAARDRGYEPRLLAEVAAVNARQRRLALDKLQAHLGELAGRRVCLLGLAFKPGTDDLRDAPALEVAAALLGLGAAVTAYDPAVQAVAELPGLVVASDVYEAAAGADAVVLVTDWPEFALLDVAELRSRMRGNLFVDGRNILGGVGLSDAGFVYESFGGSGQRRRLRPVPTRETAPTPAVDSVEATPRRSQASPR